MRFLKQSTQVHIVIGPVWDTSTGALKSDLAYNASGINCDIYKNGTKADVTLANSAGDGYFRAGSGEAQYILTLSTGHTDTIGRLRVTLSATGYYAKPEGFTVLHANVYDALFGSTALATVGAAMALAANQDVRNVGGTLPDVTLAATQSRYAPAKAGDAMTLAADQAVNVTKIAGAAVATGSAQLGVNVVNWKGAAAANMTGDAYARLGAPVGASISADVAAVADAVWDEAIAGHAGAGSTGAALAAAGGSGDPWATALPGAYGAGTAGKIIGSNLNATVSSRSAPGDKMDLVDAPNTTALTAIRTAIQAAGSTLATLLSRIVGTLDAGTHKPQSGDAYAIANHATYGNAKLAKPGDVPTADQNADALLGRSIAGGASTGRTVQQALRALRNKVAISGSTMTVYREDDSTSDWTASVTTDADAKPITTIDPA